MILYILTIILLLCTVLYTKIIDFKKSDNDVQWMQLRVWEIPIMIGIVFIPILNVLISAAIFTFWILNGIFFNSSIKYKDSFKNSFWNKKI